MISPEICVVIAAASRKMLAARRQLNTAQDRVPPVAAMIESMKSGARFRRRSAAGFNAARRSLGGVVDQMGKARAATLAAWVASATLAAAARVATTRATGSRRSNVASLAAATRRSSMMSAALGVAR